MKNIIIIILLMTFNSYAKEDLDPIIYKSLKNTILYPEESKDYGLDYLISDIRFNDMNFIKCYDCLTSLNSYNKLLKQNAFFKGLKIDKSIDLKDPELDFKNTIIFSGDTPFITVVYFLAKEYGLCVYYHQNYLVIGSYKQETKSFAITSRMRSYFSNHLKNLDDLEKHLQDVCSNSLVLCEVSENKKGVYIEATNFHIRQLEAYFFLIETSALKKVKSSSP